MPAHTLHPSHQRRSRDIPKEMGCHCPHACCQGPQPCGHCPYLYSTCRDSRASGLARGMQDRGFQVKLADKTAGVIYKQTWHVDYSVHGGWHLPGFPLCDLQLLALVPRELCMGPS